MRLSIYSHCKWEEKIASWLIVFGLEQTRFCLTVNEQLPLCVNVDLPSQIVTFPAVTGLSSSCSQ